MHSEWFRDESHLIEDDGTDAPEYSAYENDYETWCDYFSDELATLYHSLKDHAAAMGLPMLEHMTMSEFCHFAFKNSSGLKPSV